VDVQHLRHGRGDLCAATFCFFKKRPPSCRCGAFSVSRRSCGINSPWSKAAQA
jgi:hypothetical protein